MRSIPYAGVRKYLCQSCKCRGMSTGACGWQSSEGWALQASADTLAYLRADSDVLADWIANGYAAVLLPRLNFLHGEVRTNHLGLKAHASYRPVVQARCTTNGYHSILSKLWVGPPAY